jgi:hypothetical protein
MNKSYVILQLGGFCDFAFAGYPVVKTSLVVANPSVNVERDLLLISSFLGDLRCIGTSHSRLAVEDDFLHVNSSCDCTLFFSGLGNSNFSRKAFSGRDSVSCKADSGRFIALGIFPCCCSSLGSRTSAVSLIVRTTDDVLVLDGFAEVVNLVSGSSFRGNLFEGVDLDVVGRGSAVKPCERRWLRGNDMSGARDNSQLR